MPKPANRRNRQSHAKHSRQRRSTHQIPHSDSPPRHNPPHRQQPTPARARTRSAPLLKRIQNPPLHSIGSLSIPKTRQHLLHCIIGVLHLFPPSSSRSRSRALARNSRARTADSLLPKTSAISAVPNSSIAESSSTCRSPLGNLSISRSTDLMRRASPSASSAGRLLATSPSTKPSSNCSGRILRLLSSERFHVIRISQTRISRTLARERRCSSTRTKTS
jgi:hypothetical protein